MNRKSHIVNRHMPVAVQLLIALVVGGVLGFVVGWLMRSLRQPAGQADNRVEQELRQQLAQRDSDLAQLPEPSCRRRPPPAQTAEAKQAAAEGLLIEQRAMHEKALLELKEMQGQGSY